jgi:hypothetical protein
VLHKTLSEEDELFVVGTVKFEGDVLDEEFGSLMLKECGLAPWYELSPEDEKFVPSLMMPPARAGSGQYET